LKRCKNAKFIRKKSRKKVYWKGAKMRKFIRKSLLKRRKKCEFDHKKSRKKSIEKMQKMRRQ